MYLATSAVSRYHTMTKQALSQAAILVYCATTHVELPPPPAAHAGQNACVGGLLLQNRILGVGVETQTNPAALDAASQSCWVPHLARCASSLGSHVPSFARSHRLGGGADAQYTQLPAPSTPITLEDGAVAFSTAAQIERVAQLR